MAVNTPASTRTDPLLVSVLRDTCSAVTERRVPVSVLGLGTGLLWVDYAARQGQREWALKASCSDLSPGAAPPTPELPSPAPQDCLFLFLERASGHAEAGQSPTSCFIFYTPNLAQSGGRPAVHNTHHADPLRSADFVAGTGPSTCHLRLWSYCGIPRSPGSGSSD